MSARTQVGGGAPSEVAQALPPAVANLRHAVRESGLLGERARVVVMLSGGRDSVCLLDTTAAVCRGGEVRALHVNYGLRGADSDADERHCAALCEELQIELDLVRARRGEQGGNLQAWAREVRYEAAMELASELDRGSAQRALVASGHTASDQVETVLYRLAASPGRRALLGMPARDGRLVRPLLGVTREQTAAYCRGRSLRWREDASNDSERYARTRVRNGVLPALRAVHPAAEDNVLRTAVLLREETELLEALVDAELAGTQEIAIERLAVLPPALARLVVIRLAESASGRLAPQAGERVGEIVALGRRTPAGGRVELHVGALACAVIEGGVLTMRRLEPRS